MAEEAEKKDAGEGGGKGGSPLLLVIVALVSVVLGAGLNFVFAPKADAPAEQGAEAETGGEDGEGAEGESAPFRDRVVPFEPFVVNLRGADYPRYVKIRLEMETDTPEAKLELEARKSQVRDAVILLLSSKELSQVTEFEGKAFLKEELQRRVNDVMPDGSVKSVFFTEFVIQ